MWPIANSNGDPAVAMALTNGIENIIASTIGAGAGAAINGGSGASNGLGISSDLQQYNQAESERVEDFETIRDENGNLIDPVQEDIWKADYYSKERSLRDLCNDCSFLTSVNPTITDQMLRDIDRDLDAANQLEQAGRPVTSENIEKVKEWNSRNTPTVSAPNTPLLNSDLFSGPADIAKGDTSNYDTLPDFPLKDNSNFDNPQLPSGNSENQMNQPKNPSYQPTRNSPTTINERYYTAHALDRMQDRGIPPSAVEDTIKNNPSTNSYNSTRKFYSPSNNVTVITNSTGDVVMVRKGK